jgi:hypothetical protein
VHRELNLWIQGVQQWLLGLLPPEKRMVIVKQSRLSPGHGRASAARLPGPAFDRPPSIGTGTRGAFYHGYLFTLYFEEVPASEQTFLPAPGDTLQTIYRSDVLLPGREPFTCVVDALYGFDSDSLWREMDIIFKVNPFQITSVSVVKTAAKAGRIIIHPTGNLYRCTLAGPGLS